LISAIQFRLDAETASAYAATLGLPESEAAGALARAIANSAFWRDCPRAVVLADDAGKLALVGDFSAHARRLIEAQIAQSLGLLSRIRYVDYAQAQLQSVRLAEALTQRVGAERLAACEFVAIPRGGHLILALLAYALGIPRQRLTTCPAASSRPLVVVDDCALTGARFGRFIIDLPQRPIIFAHLFSSPELRAAVECAEPSVVACVAAQDLADHGPGRIADYAAWQQQRREALDGTRYWVGKMDPVAFAWNEPDNLFTDPVTGKLRVLWRLLPPERCLKNRPPAGAAPIAVQETRRDANRCVSPAPGVLTGELDGRIVIVSDGSERVWGLSGTAAAVWRLLRHCTNKDTVLRELTRRYDAPATALAQDLDHFLEQLLHAGVILQKPD
jgi:hypothetical protein